MTTSLTVSQDFEMFLSPAAAAAGFFVWQEGSTFYANDAQASAAQAWINSWNAVADAQARQLAALATQCEAALYGGHTTGTGLGSIKVSTDAGSLALLTGANSLAIAGTQTSFNFKDATGAWHTLTAAQIEALFADVSSFVQACFSYESSLAGQINAATNVAGVMAINLTAGWPS